MADTVPDVGFQPAVGLDNLKPSSYKGSKDLSNVQQSGMTMRPAVEYRLFLKENRHQLKFTKTVIVHSPPRIISKNLWPRRGRAILMKQVDLLQAESDDHK